MALGIFLFTATFAHAAPDLLVVSVSGVNGFQIRRFDGATGASKGIFSTGFSETIEGLTYGSRGNLYVGTNTLGFGSVTEVNGQTGAQVGTVYNDGISPTHRYYLPGMLRLGPDDALYSPSNKFNGVGENAILRITTDGVVSTFAAIGDSSPFRFMFDSVFGPDGNLYVSGDANTVTQQGMVVRYNGATGAFMDTFVAPGAGGMVTGAEMLFDHGGNLLVRSGGSILRYNGSTGAFMDTFVPNGSGGLDPASGMTFGPDGNLYVSSNDTNAILRYDGNTGAFIDTFVAPGAGGLTEPFQLVFMTPEPSSIAVLLPAIALLRRRRA